MGRAKVNLENYNWDIELFDWKNSTFNQFLQRMKDYLITVNANSYGIIGKTKFLVAVGIVDFAHYRKSLMRKDVKHGEMKLLLLLSLFADQEQIIINAIVGDKTGDYVRVSLDKMLSRMYGRIYDFESPETSENNSLMEALNEKFNIIINPYNNRLSEKEPKKEIK